MKNLIRLLLGLLALVAVAVGILIWKSERTRQRSQMLASEYEVECSAGTTRQVQGWGKSGYSVSCYSEANEWGLGINATGPFVGFDSGLLKIQGRMANGSPVGKWTYFDGAGNIERVVTHQE